MGSKPNITQEQVDKIKSYLQDIKYAKLTLAEIAVLCSVSVATVVRVKKGAYDKPEPPAPKPVTPAPAAPASEFPQHYTLIPYEEMKKLIRYELAVQELLNACTLSNVSDELLYCSMNALNRTLLRVIPEEYEACIEDARLHKAATCDTM
jgi:hypothetical protein